MRRAYALFLIALVGVAAAFSSYASASGQCTQPPSSGDESKKSGSGCGAAVDGDDELEIIKMSSINFEKTIAGEVDEPEDAITLVLFEGEEKRCELKGRGEKGRKRPRTAPKTHRSPPPPDRSKAKKNIISQTSKQKISLISVLPRPAVSAAFKRAAAALDGLGVQAATIDAVADQGLSKVQGGGASKTAVRAFFSTLREHGAEGKKGGERRPTNVAAAGEPVVDDGWLADPSAIAAVALEAVAAAAASRLGVEASALLLPRSGSSGKGGTPSSSSSSPSKKEKAKEDKADEKKKKKKEAEKKKAKEEEEKKKKEKDSKKKKSSSTAADGGGSKKQNKKKNAGAGGKRRKGRVNEGGGYFASSPDIDALGDSTFDANVLSADSKATMVMF